MQAIMPCFIKYLEDESTKLSNSPAAIKHEITVYTTLCVEMKALVNSCDTLSRYNFSVKKIYFFIKKFFLEVLNDLLILEE